MASAYIKDEQGGTFIPASQRPDGTWRKPRRVKDGYIPQEEVPLYESKGKQFTKNKSMYPPGASPEFIAEHKAKLEAMAVKSKTIPGLEIKPETKKKKKKNKNKSLESTTEEISKLTITESDSASRKMNQTPQQQPPTQKATAKQTVDANSSPPAPTITDPQKRLKNLRKKIREIETLEEKIQSGTLKNPEKEILDKVARKNVILKEISQLEKSLK